MFCRQTTARLYSIAYWKASKPVGCQIGWAGFSLLSPRTTLSVPFMCLSVGFFYITGSYEAIHVVIKNYFIVQSEPPGWLRLAKAPTAGRLVTPAPQMLLLGS